LVLKHAATRKTPANAVLVARAEKMAAADGGKELWCVRVILNFFD
jgi:hypothetical protein